ncbi:vWA domain-containing protein [Terricaulis silvestris]|uniref:Magnesium chelatase subunit D n=1 Tax=Terricaulis silvestris TaxID=2686094 RepID=A0A6I6MM24_9CAUL|nr:VWA domain-containing protein [Terricaulis silvestris]QGZ94276.1 magnesium chelatase subunit D [Terricaulis silvestris]
MLAYTRRAGLSLCMLILAACAGQSTTQNEQETAIVENTDEMVVTANRVEESRRAPEQRVPPPDLSAPPSPAPLGVASDGRAFARPYAQTAPQPMPGDINRDNYEHADANPVRIVAEEPVSTFSIDVDTASYSNVRRLLNEGRLPPQDAVRIEELVNYFRYDYPLPASREQPFSTSVTVAPSPWAEGRQLVHIGLQGYNIVPRQRPPLNLTLLIDVSGSMQPENKLPLALQSFRLLVDQLNARDRISIVVYAGRAGAVLEPTPGNERARILAALDNLQAGGSTAGGEGLRLAYALAEQNFNRNGVNRVIIATDGDFNVGIADPDELQDFVERKRDTGIYLSVFGFGGGNYNDLLMQRLAQNGNGVAAYIDTINEARRVLHDEMASNMFTIANDVKIQVEFNPSRVAEYRLVGYETRMLNREDFNNDAIDAGEIGAGHAVTAIYEIVPVGGRTFNDPLRYQDRAASASTAGELAFLRIRYKLPGSDTSRLIERPITNRDAVTDIARAPEATRWAAAVAGYGQLLRGDAFVRQGYGYGDVIRLAQGARGEDEFGWRAEFIQLARAAETAASMPTAENAQRGSR